MNGRSQNHKTQGNMGSANEGMLKIKDGADQPGNAGPDLLRALLGVCVIYERGRYVGIIR